MKTLLFFLVAGLLGSCYTGKEVQVAIVKVRLVKIDTVYRYDNHVIQELTWQDEQNIDYVSFAPISAIYIVGTNFLYLRKR